MRDVLRLNDHVGGNFVEESLLEVVAVAVALKRLIEILWKGCVT